MFFEINFPYESSTWFPLKSPFQVLSTTTGSVFQVQRNKEMENIKRLEKKDEEAGSTCRLEIIDRPNVGNNKGSEPEKKLTLFVLHLAIIEKTASGLGQLAFVWATVVLLGGFASDLKPKDFWFVTAILVVEGTRLFSRSGELEWQHQSPRAPPAANSRRRIQFKFSDLRRLVCAAMRPIATGKRTLSQLKRKHLPADVPLLPDSDWVFVSKNICRFLYWLQMFSAAACVALSLTRLGQQDYGDNAQINEESALNVFYSLALVESLMFLLEKGYWTWRIKHGKLLERVSDKFELGDIGVVSLHRFLFEAYSKCIDGSIFDGLKMDLVSFAKELVDSDSSDEQIIGAKILQRFVKNKRFSGSTLRKIGSSTPVIERLIDMLDCEKPADKKKPADKAKRRLASEIVSRLASRKQNALLVAAIPRAMESIASLLQTGGEGSTGGRPYEASPRGVVVDETEENEFSAFNRLGLLILKRLASWDQDNCLKIGNVRGLIARIIDLTSSDATLLCDERAPELRIKSVRRALKVTRRALKVVKILVCATGETGKILRKYISENVYLVSNIRELLQYGERHVNLQMLGVEIVTSLGMNEEAREKIGATGSMLRLILAVFFRPIVEEEGVALRNEGVALRNEAGEALAMLILESRRNCERMLREEDDVVRRLITALGVPALSVSAASILRGLCAYSAPERSDRLKIVEEAMPMVLKAIMEEKENEKLLEVSIGLALQILKFKDLKFGHEIERAGIKKEDFVGKLVKILRRYQNNPESKVPRMRRFVIELAITLMKYEQKYIELFRDLGMKQVLMRTAETTSELECFNVFSGGAGLGRLEIMISSLVDTALELLAMEKNYMLSRALFDEELMCANWSAPIKIKHINLILAAQTTHFNGNVRIN